MNNTAEHSIGLSNALLMMLLSSGLYNHVILTPILLKASGRDAWIGVLIASLIIPLLILIISFVSKCTASMSIPLWLTQNFGKGLNYVFIIPIAGCLFIMNCVTFKDTISWSIASYLPYTPPLALAIFLAILCFSSCMLGIRNIAFTAGIIAPIVMILGIGIAITNGPKKHYTYIFPALENGMGPVWHSAFLTLGGIMEIFLVLLFQQHLKKKVNFLYLAIQSLFLIGITLGPLLAAISVFGPESASNQGYPAFELWRIATIGKYISHIDFFAIFQWLAGSFIRIALLGFITMDLFRMKSKKAKAYFLAVLYITLIMFSSLPIDETLFSQFIIKYYSFLIVIVFGGALIMFSMFSIFSIYKRKIEG
ncbi:endospore germination permease [Niallia sp. JL1B1071]|uniref:endospore germination permease n=1 Tax=Niallia tiangongensis TaxID=3237105 RepID=UPI0037DD1F22